MEVGAAIVRNLPFSCIEALDVFDGRRDRIRFFIDLRDFGTREDRQLYRSHE